ncbi:DUF6095 family protein [Flavobacterium proteolyticum]|uniref:Uncharacterized protein n=1 Tax=Flavobacterium proteolyticum TaxID=2911683 RepID=A0ABR9WTE1_9FLAO|nr:DUF6095 family protein [Flavobacterium proteolyticum]MBE9576881.1 hypothetical protein [Flavobacterium proteolyticum]
MATDKNILAKGVKYLAGALPLLFLGPVIINSAFKNVKHPLYPYILGLGIIIALAAMFLIFKGIMTLVKSLFDGDKNNQ